MEEFYDAQSAYKLIKNIGVPIDEYEFSEEFVTGDCLFLETKREPDARLFPLSRPKVISVLGCTPATQLFLLLASLMNASSLWTLIRFLKFLVVNGRVC